MTTETKPRSLLSMFGAMKRALLVVNNVHGSGFDYDWTISIDKGKRVVLHSAFHCMNDGGFYDGWVEFNIIIPVKCIANWRVSFGGLKNRWKVHKYMLKDHIEDAVSIPIDAYQFSLGESKLEISKLYYFKGILK